jgi:predicted transcriptional regulator
MQNRGEIVERAVKENGLPIKKLAEKLKLSRRTIYNYFNTPDLSLDIILEIGKFIYHDFSDEITELKNIRPYVAEKEHQYSSEGSEYWKNKYLVLLEEYNALLKKVNSK